MKDLQDKLAVVTGGNAGIGLEIARELISRGARVVITGRRQEALDAAARELGDRLHPVRSDAARIADIEALVETVREKLGQVDILVVNAGIARQEPVGALTEPIFDDLVDINFKGAVFTTEKFIPLLAEGAAVIHLTSVSAYTVARGTSIYAATKAALTAYSKAAAIELADRRIRVNTVAPALTETDIIYQGAFADEKLHTYLRGMMPFKRYGKVEEVAKLVGFLVSDDAAFISGAEYTIDGAASVNEPMRALAG